MENKITIEKEIIARKIDKRTFEENTSLGQMQDRITELEFRIEELEAK